ncbi:MAG: hypothetical protein ACK4R9_04230 [Ignavibacterium sp.]
MKNQYLVILFFLYLFYSCSEKSKINYYENVINGKQIILLKSNEFTILEDTANFIGRFNDQKFINSNLIIADIIQPALFFINKNGHITKILRWRKGEGPGEVYKIGNFEIIRDRIYICDQGNYRWTVFDTSGYYIKTARPFKNPRTKDNKYYFDLWNVHQIGDSLVCSITDSRYNYDFSQYKSKTLALLDSTLEIKKIFGLTDEIYGKIRYYDPTSTVTVDKDKNIYACQRATFRIYKYDKNGNFIKAFGFKKKFRIIEEDFARNLSIDEIHRKTKTFSATVGLFYSKKGFIIQQFANVTDKFFITRDLTDRQNYIKVYDTDGNYIKSDILLPGLLIAVNDNGQLLIMESDKPGDRKIVTYDVKIVGD